MSFARALARLLPVCRSLAVPLAMLVMASTLNATWSIIIIDTRTGAIAIGSATCLTGFDLRAGSPVVVVGFGAAAAQSYIDVSGQNRLLLRNELLKGTAPAQILLLLSQQDPGHQTRQYRIADVQGRTIGFSGTGAGAYAGHLTGRTGDLVYAIQGNVLTGQPVLLRAEQAIVNTAGDIAAKLMAGMEAARLMGGDGRCSCTTGTPTGCGSPPPQFTKSAHIGYMIVARQGDKDGACNASAGCAAGSYWMNHNVAYTTVSNPDPVFTLRSMYQSWRLAWLGRPDHELSEVSLSPPTLPADGRTMTLATVTLRDWQGTRVSGSSAKLNVTLDPTSPATVQIGSVIARGGGVYSFPLTAGTTGGTAFLRIEVDDGKGVVLLSPRTAVEVSTAALWASANSLSSSTGGVVDFGLQGGANNAARGYVLLGGASGSSPGVSLPPVVLPLNFDGFTGISLQLANSATFPHTLGLLDANGRAAAAFVTPPLVLPPIVGLDLTFAWATLFPIDLASNHVTVQLAR